MTQDDILRMALDADAFGEHGTFYTLAQKRPEVFSRFASLVASAEREACAKVCEKRSIALDYGGNEFTLRGEAACAAAIRARSS